MRPYSEFQTVPGLIQARGEALGDLVAVTFEGDPCSFAELDRRSAQVHAWLLGAGVQAGDRVAMLMQNSLEFLYAWLGIARAGAISVPINTAMIGDALAYTLEHSESVGLIADAELLAAVDAAGDFSSLRWRLALGEDLPAGAEPLAAALVAAESELPPVAPLAAETPMSIVYTSGTTGMPKGVVLPHQSFTNTGGYFAAHMGLTAADRLHTCLPLFHCNAQQCGFMAAMELGVPFAINRRFSVSRFWTWIEESGATVSNLLGAMLSLLFKAPPRPEEAETTLRLIASAPIPEDLHRPFEQRFGLTLVDGYGLTETATMGIVGPIDDIRPGTIGLPVAHGEAKIVDEHGVEVELGTPGEILLRSNVPHAHMLGYFKEPEKTAEALRGGWFHTGDLGMQRDDGYFVFLDRIKDTIRRRGENISSFLIEKTVADHPLVLQCAVFGVPSELSEEDVKVIAVLREGAELDPQELVEWCAARMADFMVPRYVEYRSSLPVTETGRVHKFKLRAEGAGSAWDRERDGDLARARAER